MIIVLACAGAVGAICRYIISTVLQKKLNKLNLYSTTIINILGSFLLGVSYGLALNHYSQLVNFYPIISIGFFGAFTTFSTFSYEAYNLFIKSKRKGMFFVLFSIFCACICSTLGIYIVI